MHTCNFYFCYLLWTVLEVYHLAHHRSLKEYISFILELENCILVLIIADFSPSFLLLSSRIFIFLSLFFLLFLFGILFCLGLIAFHLIFASASPLMPHFLLCILLEKFILFCFFSPKEIYQRLNS